MGRRMRSVCLDKSRGCIDMLLSEVETEYRLAPVLLNLTDNRKLELCVSAFLSGLISSKFG